MFDTGELKHMSDPIVYPPCCAHVHLRNLDDSIDEAALKEPDFSVFSVKLVLIFRKPIAAGVLWPIRQSSPLHHWDGPKEKQAEGRDLNYSCRLMSAHPTITALIQDFGFVGFESATEASKAIVEMNKKARVSIPPCPTCFILVAYVKSIVSLESFWQSLSISCGKRIKRIHSSCNLSLLSGSGEFTEMVAPTGQGR